MTKLINVFFAVALSFIGSSAFAQPQKSGSWCGKGQDAVFVEHPLPCPPTARGVVGGSGVYQYPQQQPQYYQPQPRYAPVQTLPMVPIQGHPGMFQQGGNTYRCSTGARVLGGVVGAIVGHYVGREITTQGHNLGGGGAIAGAGFGQQISCELMASPPPQAPVVVVSQAQPQMRNHPAPHAHPVSAEEQVGGVVATPQNGTKVEEQSLPSGGQQDTCRLRIKGKPVAEIKLPLSVKKEEAKAICDEWQQREAKSRGLV